MFQPSCELVAHEGGIRAICVQDRFLYTGAMDSLVRRWKYNDRATFVEIDDHLAHEHKHWVTSMISMPSTVLPNLAPAGGFITGSMDKNIRIYDTDCVLLQTLTGHSGGVISLSWTRDDANPRLLSGSWDGTARLWDLSTLTCVQIFPGHENGVCVLGLENGSIVTGSTGEQQGNAVVNFKIRLWQPNGDLIETIQDHEGPVRQLIELPHMGGFASCSNDGSIKMRTVDGKCLLTMSHPLNSEGKPGFVLGITKLSQTNEIVSVSEDCSARIWAPDGTHVQTIVHPNGLWCVAALPNGDFVTGCDDKVARIFSRAPERITKAAVESFTKSVEEAVQLRSKGPSNVDIEKLPSFEQRDQMKGKSDGDVQMFQKSGKAWACQWSVSSQTWIEIGEITGSANKGMVDGVAYDLVIPVEIEQPGTGRIQNLEIGYNQGDNPYMVAQQFIDRHMLDQAYLNQIAQYIAERSGKTPGASFDSTATDMPPPAPVHNYQFFPLKNYTSFDGTKVDKLLDTLKKLNDPIEHVAKLSPLDFESLESIVSTLKRTAYYHATTFTPQEISVVQKALQLPYHVVFPVLDLVRLALVHPKGFTLVQGDASNHGEHLITLVLTIGGTAMDNIPIAARMLSLRVLSNMFVHPHSRRCILSHSSRILSTLDQYYPHVQHKGLCLSLITLILNFVAAWANEEDLMSTTCREVVAQVVDAFLQSLGQEVEGDILLRSCLTLGTLAILDPELRPVLKRAYDQVLRASLGTTNPTIQHCTEELKDVFNK